MGIWGFLCSTGDSLKSGCSSAYGLGSAACSSAYGLGSAACSSAHGLGSAAVTKINNGRINATQKLSDEETRAKIAPIAVDLAKNAAIYVCQEGLKSIPGGTLINETVGRSFGGEKKFDSHGVVEMKALQARVAKLEEEAIKKKSEGGLERAEKHHQPCADLKSNAYKKPEDVIRVFMMKEFMGRQFLDDLMVPDYPEVGGTRKNPN